MKYPTPRIPIRNALLGTALRLPLPCPLQRRCEPPLSRCTRWAAVPSRRAGARCRHRHARLAACRRTVWRSPAAPRERRRRTRLHQRQTMAKHHAAGSRARCGAVTPGIVPVPPSSRCHSMRAALLEADVIASVTAGRRSQHGERRNAFRCRPPRHPAAAPPPLPSAAGRRWASARAWWAPLDRCAPTGFRRGAAHSGTSCGRRACW